MSKKKSRDEMQEFGTPGESHDDPADPATPPVEPVTSPPVEPVTPPPIEPVTPPSDLYDRATYERAITDLIHAKGFGHSKVTCEALAHEIMDCIEGLS